MTIQVVCHKCRIYNNYSDSEHLQARKDASSHNNTTHGGEPVAKVLVLR